MNLEQFMNRLSDLDWTWWPLVSLRPSKDKDIDNRILLRLSGPFGFVTGLLIVAEAYILLFRAGRTAGLSLYLASFLLGYFVFFVGFKCTFAYFWNCRARRLRAAATANSPGNVLAT